jgi:hypothetical protein
MTLSIITLNYIFFLLDMRIQLVEMNRFEGLKLLTHSARNSSRFSLVYKSNIFDKQVEKLLEEKGILFTTSFTIHFIQYKFITFLSIPEFRFYTNLSRFHAMNMFFEKWYA